MTPFADLLRQGASNAWLFIPSAILLGALHGLEPGHSKTMMAAFIVAIRGTVAQAVLLGLSATLSHTAVVWGVALVGLHFGSQLNAESTEPYFQIASAALIIAIALWMLGRTYRDQQRGKDTHDHGHAPDDETKRIETGHGIIRLEVFEQGVPPRFRIHFEDKGGPVNPPDPQSVTLETFRPDGTRQAYELARRESFLESVNAIPEPHEFRAKLSISHSGDAYAYDVVFEEHGQDHHEHSGLDVSAPGFQDAHELAHANDIKRRFANREVTTGQIIMFGLTGGLVPCPASITVLLLCLQLKQYTLGLALVLCFSIGLALTMVLSGTIAALSVRQVSRRWSGFGAFAHRAPYFSSLIIICVGLYTGYLGWQGLGR